jgi:SM-20-related protein
VERSGVLGRLATTPVAQEFDGHKLEKCVINLSTASDVNFVHSHPEDKVLLYYLNLEWRDGWHGETLFYDETGKEVVFANAYTPNRLVAFDAKIPHTIRPQSHLAPQYRLTLALIYNKC